MISQSSFHKTLTIKNILLFFALCFIASNNTNAKIYKYTDASGKVYFTDRKPIDLDDKDYKEIKLSKSVKIEPKISNKQDNQKLVPFSNFAISAPKENENLSNTNGNIMVGVTLDNPLPHSYRIKFYIDKLPHGKVKSTSQLISDIEKGTHNVYAEIIEARSRKVIKTTDTINFTTLD